MIIFCCLFRYILSKKKYGSRSCSRSPEFCSPKGVPDGTWDYWGTTSPLPLPLHVRGKWTQLLLWLSNNYALGYSVNVWGKIKVARMSYLRNTQKMLQRNVLWEECSWRGRKDCSTKAIHCSDEMLSLLLFLSISFSWWKYWFKYGAAPKRCPLEDAQGSFMVVTKE